MRLRFPADRLRPLVAAGVTVLVAVAVTASATADATPSRDDASAPATADAKTLAKAAAQADDGCDPVDPAACLLPFPSDVFTKPDPKTATGIRVNIARSATPRNRLGTTVDPAEQNRNDGFSPGSMLLAHVPGIDLTATGAAPVTDIGRSLADDAPIVLIDAETGERHPYWSELDSRAADPNRRALIVRPARNLTEGKRYVVALRNLRTAAGEAIPPNPVFASLMSETPPADPGLHRRWELAQRALDSLRDADVSTDGLFLAWDFTVASERNLSERILHMRDQSFRQLGSRSPFSVVTKVTNFTPEQDPLITRQVEGYVVVPSYLNLPLGPPGSSMHYGRDGLPQRIGVNSQLAKFLCNVPRTALTTPARPALYGHGLLGDPAEINSAKLKTYAAESNTLMCASPWIGMANEDIPNVIAVFADFSRFNTIPDRQQQSFLNFLFLGRALQHGRGLAAQSAFRAGGRPLFDPSRGSLVYLGNSQGGILGGALTAVAQDFTRASLGVPAANYSTLLNRSVDFDQFQVALSLNYPDALDQQLIFALIQILWDRGDANGYLAHLTDDPLAGTPAHRVVLVEAFGDHQVANVATEVEARTIGAKVRQPALAPGRSIDVEPFWGIEPVPGFPHAGPVLVMVDSGSPPPPPGNVPPRDGADPHGHPANSPAVRAMIAHFLATGELIDTCGGEPCTAPAG
jgi:hypothetical protein